MLEFCYNFLDMFLNRQDFELCQMNTDSLHLSMSDEFPDNTVKPKLRKDKLTRKIDLQQKNLTK